MQWRPLHYKSLLKSHAAFHVYGEHMGKPAIFRPQNKPLCSWTHDRTGSFLPREPHPRGVGPLTVIKPPQFSQQNRSYIKLKYRGLINKAWAGEKKNWVKDSHNDSPHGHGQRKAMRYISKHEADVYLDKEEKTQSGLRTDEKALTPVLSSNVKFGLHYNRANSRSCTMMWDGPIFVLLFSIPHWKSRCNVFLSTIQQQ